MSKTAKTATKSRKVAKKLSNVPDISGKRLRLFKMISAPKGASLKTLVNALDWQAHTVRGAISTLSSTENVKVSSTRDPRRGRVYQVAASA